MSKQLQPGEDVAVHIKPKGETQYVRLVGKILTSYGKVYDVAVLFDDGYECVLSKLDEEYISTV